VKRLKNKWIFFIALILLVMLLVVGLYFLRGYLPLYAKDFTTDIISVLALVISVGFPLYKELFPKNPVRQYHVEPVELISFYDQSPDIRIRAHLENSGEKDVNIQFKSIDFMSERFVLTSTMDSRGKSIDSSIELSAGKQKDVYLAFEAINTFKNRVRREYNKAFDKGDARLIKRFRHEQAKLTWSDVTPIMQEKHFPLGALLMEYHEIIDAPY
jgi:hypothetical protein